MVVNLLELVSQMRQWVDGTPSYCVALDDMDSYCKTAGILVAVAEVAVF